MLRKTIITIAISAAIGGAVALAPLDTFARGVAVGVVTAAVVTVVGSPVGTGAGLAAAASVAVGLGVVASGVVRLAVSGAGSVVSAQLR